MKNKWGILLIGLGLIAILVLLLRWAWNKPTSVPSNTATLAGKEASQPNSSLEKKVQLTAEQTREYGIELGQAGAAQIETWLDLPGEVALNEDRITHVVPKVAGVVREVRRTLGDIVAQGDVLAILESRELADCKAAFLAAKQRVSLAENIYNREEQLWKKKISAEQDFLNAQSALAEAQIEMETNKQKLYAIGLSQAQVAAMALAPQQDLARYQLLAPLAGTIVEKHADLGEVIKDDTPCFKIADLSTVWINLSVQQKDIPFVRKGQHVIFSSTGGQKETAGAISYIDPIGFEQTRTIHARVVASNGNGQWRPGLFVTSRVAVENLNAGVAIPSEAIILVEGKPCVFVKSNEGFMAQIIQPGKSDQSRTEVVSGLAPGQAYVRKGAFTLKSEMDKPEAE